VFLQSHEDVVAAADYLNNLRTQQRVEFTVPWIQDPNIRPGDQMHFYTRYAETPVQGVVGEQELVFDGGLRGATIIRAPMQG
jgi:hypothetical protein